MPDATPISPSLRWVETDDPAIASRDQNKPIDPLLTQDSPVSIVFGHRPSHNGRHLTLTVDVNSLLGDPRLIGFVRSHINRFFGDDDPKIGTIPVWIPVDSRAQVSWKDVAVDLFKAAASKVSVEISFITRFAFAGETIFDQSRVGAERVRKARSLVIFDWGAITGTTIHQLVNVGAMLGADRILVLIASNQLSAHEIAFHNSIDGLGVKRLKKSTDLFASAEFVYSSVEVKFEQFSTTSLGRFAELDCPVCKQIIEISNLVSADSFLENYKVEEAIRLNKYALNPDGTQGTADRLLGIAIFRDLVDRSRLSTSLRKQVLDRLVEIAAFDVSRRSHQSQAFPVIELLYLESHWLKLPPLKYKVCRANLASICIKLIVAGDEAVQAVCLSVLRRISKTEFVAQCANLFLKLPSRWIAQQTLLAGLHSYISRDYHQSTSLSSEVGTVLRQIQKTISARQGFERSADTVQYLIDVTNFLSARAKFSDDHPAQISADLKRLLLTSYPPHDPVPEASTKQTALSFFEDIDTLLGNQFDLVKKRSMHEKLKSRVAMRVEQWKLCERFLLDEILPRMVHLPKELNTTAFSALLRGDSAWLRQLLLQHQKGLPLEMAAGRALRTIARVIGSAFDPTAHDELREAKNIYELEVGRLHNCLLRAKKVVATIEHKPSLVAEYFEQFPSALGAAFEVASAEYRTVSVIGWDSAELVYKTELYCPTEVIARVVCELLRNVDRHWQIKGTAPFVQVFVKQTRSHVHLRLINPSELNEKTSYNSYRHGLEQCHRDLLVFGGAVSAGHIAEAKFEVQLTLKKW